MAYDSICKCCGKKFLKTAKNIKYCNLLCSIKYNKDMQYKNHHAKMIAKPDLKECEFCGEKYISKSIRQKYCKKECQQRDRNLKWLSDKH